MQKNTSRVSPKGQVTIPVEIRERFDIRTRDRVVFRVVDGNITLTPTKSRVDELYGSLAGPELDIDWKEAEQIAKDEFAERLVAEDRTKYLSS